MRIIIATPIYPPEIGGPATYTKELCERLAGLHEITVITYTNSAEAFPKTRLVPVGKGRPLPVRLAIFFFKLLRRAKDADVIYVQNAMAAGLPVALVSTLTGIPFVLKFVGDEAWERATQHKFTTKRLEEFLAHPDGPFRIRMMMRIQGFVLRRAAVVTTPSAYLLQEIIKTYGIKRERGVVNYNAADKTEELPFPVTRIPHQIATTARLVKWKGIEGIIRAVALLKEKFPDIKLVVAGDGPEMDDLKKTAHDLGVADHIDFLGNISRAETWRLRKQSEVYILNSTYEGLPHTVLTSFAAKIPTVATDIPGTNEALYHEKTGLLVKPGDDAQLARAIERLLDDPELGITLAQNGTKLLKEKFSWEVHLKNLNDIFKSVIA
ncbi:MAG: glycosyltransferase family 4 protein [Candidatus Yonathbacteria bacterium]|nr:glycosyltransferase family 4 protein [Candidatus Yonathbacteria bacterium]